MTHLPPPSLASLGNQAEKGRLRVLDSDCPTSRQALSCRLRRRLWLTHQIRGRTCYAHNGKARPSGRARVYGTHSFRPSGCFVSLSLSRWCCLCPGMQQPRRPPSSLYLSCSLPMTSTSSPAVSCSPQRSPSSIASDPATTAERHPFRLPWACQLAAGTQIIPTLILTPYPGFGQGPTRLRRRLPSGPARSLYPTAGSSVAARSGGVWLRA